MVDEWLDMPAGFRSEARAYGFAVYCDACGERIGGFTPSEVEAARDACRKHSCPN